MTDRKGWGLLRKHALAIFLIVLGVVLFLLFSGYLTE
jgi:hypothetical protein